MHWRTAEQEASEPAPQTLAEDVAVVTAQGQSQTRAQPKSPVSGKPRKVKAAAKALESAVQESTVQASEAQIEQQPTPALTKLVRKAKAALKAKVGGKAKSKAKAEGKGAVKAKAGK